MRQCKKCGQAKDDAQFYFDDGQGQSGYRTRCLQCKQDSKPHQPEWYPKIRFWIRAHAIRRYLERVRPTWDPIRDYSSARLEMLLRIEELPVQSEPPEWVHFERGHRFDRGYLVDGDVVFCLSAYRTGRRGYSARSDEAVGEDEQPDEYIKVSTVLTRQSSEDVEQLRRYKQLSLFQV